MLTSLNPLSLPLAVDITAGNQADDPLYGPLYQRVKQIINQSGLLVVGDSKMSALGSRGEVAGGSDYYLTGVHPDMVRLWRQRWQMLEPIPLSVAERLEDLPRPESPARITAGQRCQIEALTCAQPEKSGRPITHWTNRAITAELIQRKIVEHISPRHAGRLLKRGRSQKRQIRPSSVYGNPRRLSQSAGASACLSLHPQACFLDEPGRDLV